MKLAIVQEREPGDPLYVPLTWRAALGMVPAGAACVVVDSLETWADRTRERHELIRALRFQDARVKVIIAPFDAAYAMELPSPVMPATEAMFTIAPPTCLRSSGTAARTQ